MKEDSRAGKKKQETDNKTLIVVSKTRCFHMNYLI